MKTKTCKICKANKPASEFFFYKRTKDKLQYSCKQCQRDRYKSHKRKCRLAGVMTYSQRTRQRLRFEILKHYGGKCKCCGESRIEFLAIDHTNGGGNKQRRQIYGCSGLYCWLKRNGFPGGFRVLCHNCNQSFGAYGYCPHTTPEKRLMCPPKAAYERTHCKRGHKLVGKAVIKGTKRCAICRKASIRRYYEANTEKLNRRKRLRRSRNRSASLRLTTEI